MTLQQEEQAAAEVADLRQRMLVARSVLLHRFDILDPNVIALDRALLGWTLDELAAGEQR